MAKNKSPKKQGKRPRKRTWTRIEKKDRRNLKMWAEGARESILLPHLAGYTDALERGWRAERDYVRDVCNEFHARISWRVADDEEPEEPLPDYDPMAAPEVEELDAAETEAKRARVETLNARINRWLKYRAKKLRRPTMRNRANDPWAVLLAKLAGVKAPPKARQGFQQYMHESYETDIKPVVEARWKAQLVEEDGVSSLKTGKAPNAPFRAQVARELFKELSDSERDELAQRAKDEAAELRREYLELMKGPPSRAPKDRQACIDNLGTFMTEVFKGVHEYTGLSCFAVFGGPIPMYQGDLRTLTVAYGRNQEPTPCHFPQWGKARFGQDVLEFMREWLKTAYTPAQCAEAALPNDGEDDDDDPLARAKYRFDPVDDWGNDSKDEDNTDDTDDESGSASDSASDSDSDSDSESEDEAGNGSGGVDVRGVQKKSAKKKVEVRKERSRASERAKATKKSRKSKGEALTGGKGKSAEGGKGKGKEKAVAEDGKKKKREPNKGGNANEGKKRAREEATNEGAKKKTRVTDGEDAEKRPRPKTTAKTGTASGSGDKALKAKGGEGRRTVEGENGGAAKAPSGGGEKEPTGREQRPDDGGGAGSSGHGAQEKVPPPPPPACPAGAPEYYKEIYAEVTGQGLGEDFNALLTSLSAVEEAYQWVKWEKRVLAKGLRTQGRPSQVTAWVQAGRGVRGGVMGGGAGPTLSDTESFSDGWWGWWRGMQPVWRKPNATSSGFLRDGYGGGGVEDWATLRFPGPNGALSLVASLFWWGRRLRYKEIEGESLAKWTEAVRDVTWMLKGLVEVEKKERA